MSIGPVEILVISFPGNKFNGDVAPALAELVKTGQIKVIDLVFVAKDAAGDVVAVELSELDEPTGAAFSLTSRSPAACSPKRTSRTSPPTSTSNSSAAILLFEHVWATRFRDAVVDSGGELLASIRIPKEAIDEVVAAN